MESALGTYKSLATAVYLIHKRLIKHNNYIDSFILGANTYNYIENILCLFSVFYMALERVKKSGILNVLPVGST